MAFKVKKEKQIKIGEWKVSKKKFKALPDWEEKFLMRFPPKTRDIFQRIKYLYGVPQLERREGTLVRFGRGEMDIGVIKKSTDEGVWVQPIEFDEFLDKGFEPIGKPIFIHRERFEKHLGEKGAVGVEILMFQ